MILSTAASSPSLPTLSIAATSIATAGAAFVSSPSSPPSTSSPPSSAPRCTPSSPKIASNPNASKLSKTVSTLSCSHHNLHNRILILIHENDLDEAFLLVRHSIYSNCHPTIFTCNAILVAFLCQFHYADLLSLHRFITQASITPTVITHNLCWVLAYKCIPSKGDPHRKRTKKELLLQTPLLNFSARQPLHLARTVPSRRVPVVLSVAILNSR